MHGYDPSRSELRSPHELRRLLLSANDDDGQHDNSQSASENADKG